MINDISFNSIWILLDCLFCLLFELGSVLLSLICGLILALSQMELLFLRSSDNSSSEDFLVEQILEVSNGLFGVIELHIVKQTFLKFLPGHAFAKLLQFVLIFLTVIGVIELIINTDRSVESCVRWAATNAHDSIAHHASLTIAQTHLVDLIIGHSNGLTCFKLVRLANIADPSHPRLSCIFLFGLVVLAHWNESHGSGIDFNDAGTVNLIVLSSFMHNSVKQSMDCRSELEHLIKAIFDGLIDLSFGLNFLPISNRSPSSKSLLFEPISSYLHGTADQW